MAACDAPRGGGPAGAAAAAAAAAASKTAAAVNGNSSTGEHLEGDSVPQLDRQGGSEDDGGAGAGAGTVDVEGDGGESMTGESTGGKSRVDYNRQFCRHGCRACRTPKAVYCDRCEGITVPGSFFGVLSQPHVQQKCLNKNFYFRERVQNAIFFLSNSYFIKTLRGVTDLQ